MTVRYSSFEGQTSGTTWNAANSGGGSGDAINAQTGGGTATFSSAQAMHGSLSLLINTSANQARSEWTGLSATNLALRMYVRLNSGTNTLVAAQDVVSFQAGPKLQFSATRQLKVLDAGGTLLQTWTAMSLDTWYRIELYAVKGGTTSTGTIQAAYYLGDSTTPVESQYLTTTGNSGTSNYTSVYWGKLTGGSVVLNVHIDDVATNDAATGLLGPAVVTTTAVAATATAAAGVPVITSSSTVTSVAAASTAAAGVPAPAAGAALTAVAATATASTSPPAAGGGIGITAVTATATASANAPVVSGGSSGSTVRILKLTGAAGSTAGNSTVRILGLTGANGGATSVTIVGATELECGEPFTLAAVAPGATSWTWVQTAGPTVVNTGSAGTFQGIAPIGRLATTIAFQVTADPGGVTDTHSIAVSGASRFTLTSGEWVPEVRYVLVSA